jgi:hypothetical protein
VCDSLVRTRTMPQCDNRDNDESLNPVRKQGIYSSGSI